MRIRARHWLAALIVAGIAHAALFLRYSDLSQPAAEDPGERAVRIGLAPVRAPDPEPAPEPEPEPEPEPQPEPPPEPEPQPQPEPEPQPEPKPEPVPTAVPDPEPAPPPAQAKAEPPPPAERIAEEARQGTTGGVADTPPDYRDRIRAWLERHKDYPRRARRLGQEGTVELHFVMDREGRVLEWEIRATSGYRLLDDAVAEMIERANPLPAMPSDMAVERLALTVPINFQLH